MQNNASTTESEDNPDGTPKNTGILLEWTDYVVVLVDGSGSMYDTASETIQGFNALIRQQGSEQLTWLRVIQFSTPKDRYTGARREMELRTLFDNRLARSDARGMALVGYQPEGDTPLYGAVLDTINKLEAEVKPQDHVLVVIQTDGIENASPKWATLDTVKGRIAEKQADGWTFAYLGVELDAWKTGELMGLGALNAQSYSPQGVGLALVLKNTSQAIDRWRAEHAQVPGRSRKPDELAGARFFPLQLPAPEQYP